MRRKINKEEALANVSSDLPFILFVIVLLAFVVAFIWMNPVATLENPQENALRVEATWDEGLPTKNASNGLGRSRQALLEREDVLLRPGHSAADVDLWMCRIGSTRECIGYNTPGRQTTLFKLDTDDLGWARRDVKNDLNVEIMTTRRSQLPAGTYVINVHLFSLKGEEAPIVANVRVLINEGKPNQVILERRVELAAQRQEKNAFVFEVDEEGEIIPGTIAEGLDSMCIATCR